MGRLIDADYYCKVNGCSLPYGDVVECVNCCICDCPTIEAEPVKHGHWLHCEDEPTMEFACSECLGHVRLYTYANRCYYKYCPNCGAKMDSKEVVENAAD